MEQTLYSNMLDTNKIVSWIGAFYHQNRHNGIILDCYRDTPESLLLLSMYNQITTISNNICIIKNDTDFIKHPSGTITARSEKEKVISILELDNTFITIGNLNKIDALYLKPFKRHHLCVDLLPFGSYMPQEIDSIIKMERKAINLPHVNDFELSYDELVWAYDIDHRVNIFQLQDVSKHQLWFSFSLRQKLLLSKIHQNILMSKNKYIAEIPVFQDV